MSQDAAGGLVKNLIANLEDIGVSSENIGFANVSMHSEKFVCIRENKHSSKASLKIIDLRNGIEVSEKQMSADSAIMNPSKPHLALRALSALQVFNIDTKSKIASVQIGFEIIFWNWVNDKTLFLVSESAIYRWEYELKDSIPILWFEKSAVLNDCQIINAQIDNLGKWCFLSGISLKNGKIEGVIQLFNEEKKVSQIIEGHAGSFFSLKKFQNEGALNIFAYSARTKITEMRLHLFQIDANASENNFSKKIVELSTNEIPENDFAIRVSYDSNFNLVFVYTKFGFVFIIEPETGVCIMNEKYSDSPLYLITPSNDQTHHFVLNRKGDILQTSIDIDSFFNSCIGKGVEYFESVGIIMDNVPLIKQESIYRNQFDKLKNSERYQDALFLVAKSSKPFMRTFEYLSSIKDFPNVNGTSALLEYFAIILEDDILNEVESLELVQLALKKKKIEIVQKWLVEDQIFCTTQLGNLVLSENTELALQIYEKSKSDAMTAHCLAILGKFDEFTALLKCTSEKVDLSRISSKLIKSQSNLLPKFLLSAIEANVSLIDEVLLQEIFEVDLGTVSVEIDGIISKNSEILAQINSESINTQLSIRLLNQNPPLFSTFLKNCDDHNLVISKSEILPLLKENDSLKPIAFSFESNLNECLQLSVSMVGQEKMIKSTNLSKSDVKKFIFTKIEENPSKFGNICAKLGEFIAKEDFDVIKDLLKSNVDEESFCDFLVFWSGTSEAGNSLTGEILRSVIKLGDEKRLLEFTEKAVISDPKEAFDQISKLNYKSHSLKIVSSKYNMHKEMFLLFDSQSDTDEALKYCDLIGQDALWTNLSDLLKAGVAETTILRLLKMPPVKQKVVQIASELEKNDKLTILSNLALSEEAFTIDPLLLPIMLKVLAEKDEKKFLDLVTKTEGNIMTSVLQYCETKNLKLAIKYYLSINNATEILRLCIKFDEWNTLSLFLINFKNISAWTSALETKSVQKLFDVVIVNSDKFQDTESASCLIKALVTKNDSEKLMKIMKSWLEYNKVLSSSRSLQTLYMIQLIKNNSEDIEVQAMTLDNYNIEEVLNAAVNSSKLDIGIKILEKYEQWNYAFKFALYGLKDAAKAQYLAEKSGHHEAWHALAEFTLISGDACEAVKFAKLSGNFRRQKELVIMLHLNENYKELLDYLGHLKSSSSYEQIYERETVLCLMKLGKKNEINTFINSASSTFANELGKVLYREGSLGLAANCFKQAGNHEKAALCFLQLGNIEIASDLALKCNKFELWLDIVKLSLTGNKPEIARKFGLKCAQQSDRIEELLMVYENVGAYDKLLEIIDVILESSVPPQHIMNLIGDVYCREFPENLESFVSKHHSTIPVSFVTVMGKYRRWKEAFKLFLLRSNLDEALELVMRHPSIEFDHLKLTAVLSKIKNQKVLENLLQYYFEFDPRMILSLQDDFIERLHLGNLINFLKQRKILFVIDKTMRRYQNHNPGNVIVSMGLNEHLMQINDYYGLIDSIKKCPTIDATRISEYLKTSEQRHFRILAAKFMANSGEFIKALSILVEEDALIETLMILSQSSNSQYAEAILSRYALSRNAVMFLSVSYVLYDLLRPDILFESTQRSGFQELSLPLFCQILKHKLK